MHVSFVRVHGHCCCVRFVVGFDSHRGQNIFSLPRVVPCFPLLGLTPCGLFMGLSSTLIYTSELILCFTICVPSATRHNIHKLHLGLNISIKLNEILIDVFMVFFSPSWAV